MNGQQTLIACDLETTGLDPCADDILEISLVAIDLPRFTMRRIFHGLVMPTSTGLARLQANPRVLEMHDGSGLLAALEHGPCAHTSAVEESALAFLDSELGVGQKSPLFGANPTFDRGFLEAHMPMLASRFHYRSFDVNSLHLLKLALTGQWGDAMRSKGGAKHRAIDDCIAAIGHVHEFVGWASNPA